MGILAAFQPRYGSGITESATTSATPYTIDDKATTSGGGSKALVVTNQGDTNGVYVKVGLVGVVATDADYYVPPNAQICLAKAETDTTISLFATADSTDVHVIVGEGF